MQTNSKWLFIALAALAAAAFITHAAPALAGPGYVNFTLGQKMFDSDDWDPIDKQTAFGVESAFGPSKWPVQLAAYLNRSSKEKSTQFEDNTNTLVAVTLDATTTEFGFGLNKSFGASKLRPYIGAGGVYTNTEFTVRQSGYSASDNGNGFGFWGGAGAFYRLGPSFNLGGGVRYSSVTTDFGPFTGTNVSYDYTDVNSGGVALHVLIGWSWPKMPQ
ncbi:MAG TPA: outer membrane beta-barrel protein [Candidatus Eisenbacteria bacterium]|nr:outer membrane beta-barrel protein [Candidatus Eisenbacteria bacterium]